MGRGNSGRSSTVGGVSMPQQQAAGVKKLLKNLENSNKDSDVKITNVKVTKRADGSVNLEYDFEIDNGYTTNPKTGKKVKRASSKGHTTSWIDKKGKVIAFNAQ